MRQYIGLVNFLYRVVNFNGFSMVEEAYAIPTENFVDKFGQLQIFLFLSGLPESGSSPIGLKLAVGMLSETK